MLLQKDTAGSEPLFTWDLREIERQFARPVSYLQSNCTPPARHLFIYNYEQICLSQLCQTQNHIYRSQLG